MPRTPKISEEKVREILAANGVDLTKVCLLAIRGYYLDSMGVRQKNDRRIWDDAIIIWTPEGIEAYQGNTDPNGYRRGRGFGKGKGMARLKEGIHLFGTGSHKGKPAFRQCEVFTVIRDGNPPYEHKGFHAINLHSGGEFSTSSLGCQTIPKSSWQTFRKNLYRYLTFYSNPKRNNDWGESVRSFPYVLIDEKSIRKGGYVVSRRYLKK